jgi:hypothetical protein
MLLHSADMNSLALYTPDWSIPRGTTENLLQNSALLHAILHSSHHLLNVLLQIANKLSLSNQKKKKTCTTIT